MAKASIHLRMDSLIRIGMEILIWKYRQPDPDPCGQLDPDWHGKFDLVPHGQLDPDPHGQRDLDPQLGKNL